MIDGTVVVRCWLRQPDSRPIVRGDPSSRLTGSAMNTVFSCLEASCNPFALMVNQGRVLAAVQRSDQLNGLASRVFRPLDSIPASASDAGEMDDTSPPDRRLE